MFTNTQQLTKMLQLQTSMNAKVNPNWLTAGYPFLRANVVEGAEAMEHHGWKWWKRQELDKNQFAIELVDIWHFTLSHFIVRANGNINLALQMITDGMAGERRDGLMFDGSYYNFSAMDTIHRMELLIGLSVSRRVSIPLFATLIADAGMNSDGLYKSYVGKNVLNFFRQDHGYKEGTYLKFWEGSEDNVVLAMLQDDFPEDSPEDLYSRLDERYKHVARNPA